MVESGIKPKDFNATAHALNYYSLLPFHYHKEIEVLSIYNNLYISIIYRYNKHTILLITYNFKTMLQNVYSYNLFHYHTTHCYDTQTRI